jgi:Putative transposase/Transposase zinc-binding domain
MLLLLGRMLAISIKSIFSDHWKSEKLALSRRYESSHWESIVESVEKMLSCREPSSGYAEYICPHCGTKKKCPFTCKGRFCTSCGKKYTDEWVQRTVDDLIDAPHRHLVLTIAEELRGVLFWHRSLLKGMMDCAAQTALEVLQIQKSEAVPGILAVVHTFGRDLKFNPHVHLLMTEGGLRGGQWEPIPFLPYALLRKKWQYHLLTEVKGRWAKSREDSRFIDRLFKENVQGFYVNGESQMSSSRYAARYIGRYIARPALAEHKITSYDGQWVTFWYESHEEKKRVYRRLEAREFIERLIDHIPLKGFKMVRHYGLYARRSKGIALEVLSKCGNFLQKSFAFLSAPAKVLGWRQRLMQTFGQDPLRCPRCGEEMELWRIWHPRYGDLFDLGRDSPGVELFDEQNSANGKAQGFLEGSRWASQLSLFPV